MRYSDHITSLKTRKPLVWHRYVQANLFNMMAKALTQAFRISAAALDVGINEWDFSAVQKDSTDAWIQFDRHCR